MVNYRRHCSIWMGQLTTSIVEGYRLEKNKLNPQKYETQAQNIIENSVDSLSSRLDLDGEKIKQWENMVSEMLVSERNEENWEKRTKGVLWDTLKDQILNLLVYFRWVTNYRSRA